MARRDRNEPEPGTSAFGARAAQRREGLKRGADLRVKTAAKRAKTRTETRKSVLEDKEYN